MTTPEVRVSEIVDSVLDGRLASSRACELLTEIPDDVDVEFVRDRDTEIRKLIQRIYADGSALRVHKMTELAVAAAELLGDDWIAHVLLAGASSLIDLGSGSDALSLLDRAEPLLGDNPGLTVFSRRMRLHVLANNGAHEEFDALCPAVIADAEQLAAHIDLAAVLSDKAASLAERGLVVDALHSARAALSARRRAESDPPHKHLTESRLTYHLAQVADQAGQLEEALSALENARLLALSEQDAEFAAWMLSEIGFLWDKMQDRERAEGILERAAREADQVGRKDWAAHWRREVRDDGDLRQAGEETRPTKWARALAILRRQPERLDEAIKLFRECVADARKNHDPVNEADARCNLGFALSRAGQSMQAEMAVRGAILVAQRINDPLREMTYRTNLSRMIFDRLHLEEAREEIESALAIGEKLRAQVVSTEMRQSVAASLANAYDVAVVAAAVSYRPGKWMIAAGSDPDGSEPRPDLLFDLGQRSRAANLVEALRIGAAVERSGEPRLVQAMLALRAADITVELAAAEHTNLTEPIAARTRAAEELHTSARALGVDLGRKAELAGVTELASMLGDGEVLVDLLTVPEGVAVCCLTGDHRTSAGLLGWPIKDRHRLLRRLVRTRRNHLGTSAEDLDDTHAELESALQALDDALLHDIARMVREAAGDDVVRKLVVSPENELFQLPFWRLAALLGDATVSVLPTSAALPVLRERTRSGAKPWLSVAEPTGSLRYTGIDVPADLGYADCPPRADELLAALPGAGRVHFATHGHFQSQSAYRSGLEVSASDATDPLAAPDTRGRTDVELFTAAQVAGRLHLPHCELAVLSACESGLPRQHDASEFTGLPGAFLIAGARNVVASLWPAHDGAAAILMQDFYRHARTEPFSSALAKARAQLAAMSRAEVVRRLGDLDVPVGDQPFACSVFTDCFQHFGVD
ncbi:CHAT domain-containing protein [Lentzea sp. NPDC051838]|uniref:CHAT domain-containing protein n=1 Tax=Lentzea sp. NPDC051838 TaxID=3154849 RepID=UPI0034187AC9